MTPAVQIENVTKRFGEHTAVNNLSLTVPANSVYGFIGPNGSGKTTTLRMIMRIYHPDEGRVVVLGEDRLGAANDLVGYLPEDRGLYKSMKVRDVLKFYSELKGHTDCDSDIDDWLERLDLADSAKQKVETLSKGMYQRVQFIAAVIARPKLVLLDEPFSGLDPVNALVLRKAIKDLRTQHGATIIFSTHNMKDAEELCDYIFMIYKGNKVLDGTLKQIQATYPLDTVKVKIEGDELTLRGLPGVIDVKNTGVLTELRIDRNADTQRLLSTLASKARVTHFEVANPTLHDIFIRIARPESNGSETEHA